VLEVRHAVPARSWQVTVALKFVIHTVGKDPNMTLVRDSASKRPAYRDQRYPNCGSRLPGERY
jgi:hypothetical protein